MFIPEKVRVEDCDDFRPYMGHATQILEARPHTVRLDTLEGFCRPDTVNFVRPEGQAAIAQVTEDQRVREGKGTVLQTKPLTQVENGEAVPVKVENAQESLGRVGQRGEVRGQDHPLDAADR
jgi:hypothetical protein